MKLVVNGEPQEASDGITILGLIQSLGLDDGPVAVERNLEVVPRKDHATTELRDGDQLEIVHFVGGG